jgi:tripartite-type tricarboxylate transporter receptor subunit TctC
MSTLQEGNHTSANAFARAALARVTRSLHVAAVALSVVAASWGAADGWAENFPARTLRIVVPYPAGSTADIRARELAPRLATRLGQSVIVENKPGAAGMIGTALAARAPADGYTLLWGFNANLGIVPHTSANAGYDPLKDFAPVAQVMRTVQILVVHPGLPAKSLAELVSLAKTKPGQLTYGSSGIGSIQHLSIELLAASAGMQLLNVPYKGDNEVFLDLINGRLAMTFATLTAASPNIRSGKVRALAVSGIARLPNFPDVPTVREQGYPDYEWHNWVGYVVPAATPKAVIARLNREINDIYTTELRPQLEAIGAEIVTGTPEEFGALIQRDYVRYGKLVRQLGLQAQ